MCARRDLPSVSAAGLDAWGESLGVMTEAAVRGHPWCGRGNVNAGNTTGRTLFGHYLDLARTLTRARDDVRRPPLALWDGSTAPAWGSAGYSKRRLPGGATAREVYYLDTGLHARSTLDALRIARAW